MRAEYEIRLAEAQEEAAQIREKAKVQGEVIIAEARDAATAESARITETARVQIAAERVQAVNKLKTEVGTLATTLAGKIVGEALEDDERSRRTVDRFLADLESQQVSS
ncbi:MAG: hypothetical protein CSA83_00915 [Actinomycetales bacterium]|nr:MAG: hypothetical protein CSA83_00915 [Actinomycetales bacterium]